MRKFDRYLALLLIILSLMPAFCGARADSAVPVLLQAPYAGWLRDPAGQLTIDDVAARDSEFQPLEGALSRGHTRDVYWLRLSLSPAQVAANDYWLILPPPLLDDVRIFSWQADESRWSERRGGNALPFNVRENAYRSVAFPLLDGGAAPVFYLRVASSGPLAVAPQLWPASALHVAMDRTTLMAGGFLGVMAATALINLLGWLVTRRDIYGLFALFVACSALRWAGLDGLISQHFSPDNAVLPRLIDDVLLGAQTVTGSLCQIRLLRLAGRFPFILRYYQLGGVATGLLVMLTPWIGYFGELSTLMFFCLLPAPLLSIPAYARLWREGELSGRLISLVLPLHFLVMWPAILGNLGWLPFLPVFAHAARVAVLPVVLALHISIALQTREAERARDAARHQVAQVQAASERERRAREEREYFLAMIAHEVRTPVAVIDAAAHSLRLLDEHKGDPDLRAGRYENIRNAVARMRTLMELAETEERLQAGGSAINPGLLDLAGISRDALASFGAAISERVAITAPETQPSIEGDARLLYFALLNMIDNAAKYADPGTPIRIDIGASHDSDTGRRGVHWRIRDCGPGIPESKADVIFDKYLRLDESSSQPGLGLGLALAREIVAKHAGYLRLDRSWPHGACFILWLPERL